MKKGWLSFVSIAVVLGGVLLINTIFFNRVSTDVSETLDSLAVEVEPEPTLLYGMVVDNHVVIEDKIKRNERLGDILSAYNVPARLVNQLSSISRSVFDVRKIAPNKKYTLICHPDSMKTAKALVYEPNPIEYIIFRFGDSLSVDKYKREIITLEKTISGEINTTLSAAIEEQGAGMELTNKFVDIFGWQVDFQRLQKGDRFKLIYEENQVEGKSIGIGKILGIYFEHYRQTYYAYPFDQGEGIDYFDDQGKSLRKALLKYPIEFTRISSRYTMNRFHPVQKKWKAHLGTDFAAPTGTPIRSVGEGTVEEAKFSTNNGNYVKIRHNSTYTTQYLHMSKIADGVRAGTRVRQGQTIGYVGSTGLATGPHLCYRFWKNGVQVDALTVDLPPSQPINEAHVEEFNAVKEALKQRLDSIPFEEAPSNTLASL
jgi:murein DD-endopeptidase MepM/ murein hydrolase activator NlpD